MVRSFRGSGFEAAVSAFKLTLTLPIFLAFAIGSAFPLHADILYASENNQIVTYNTAQSNPSSVVFTTADLDQPIGMAFNSSGNLFVANSLSGNIDEYTPSGTPAGFVSTGGLHTQGLVFNSAGDLLVSTNSTLNILEYTPSAQGSVYATLPNNLSNPGAMAFDSQGDLFVAIGSTNKVYEFNSSGVGSVYANAPGGIIGVAGMAFDNNGNLYISGLTDFNSLLGAMIEEMSPSGVWTTVAVTETCSEVSCIGYEPGALAFDSEGNLYVADETDGGIIEVGYGVFATGPQVNSLTFGPSPGASSTPEPSTLFLTLLGTLIFVIAAKGYQLDTAKASA